MLHKSLAALVVAGFFTHTALGGVTISQVLGDSDFFGFGGGPIGTPVPAFDFDNQTVGDPAFTDKDLRQVVFGPDSLNDVAWIHDMSIALSGFTILSATLKLAIGGIQDGDPQFGPLDDRIFLEGIEVPGAFDALNQGPFGTGFVSFILDAAQLTSFSSDRVLDIAIDGGMVAPGFPGAGSLESYFLDFSELMVVVPEPTTASLVGLGLIALGAMRRRRR